MTECENENICTYISARYSTLCSFKRLYSHHGTLHCNTNVPSFPVHSGRKKKGWRFAHLKFHRIPALACNSEQRKNDVIKGKGWSSSRAIKFHLDRRNHLHPSLEKSISRSSLRSCSDTILLVDFLFFSVAQVMGFSRTNFPSHSPHTKNAHYSHADFPLSRRRDSSIVPSILKRIRSHFSSIFLRSILVHFSRSVQPFKAF